MDCSFLTLWGNLFWDGLVVTVCSIGLGLLWFTLRMNQKRWTPLWWIVASFVFLIFLTHAVHLTSFWMPMDEFVWVGSKLALAGMALIVAVTSMILLPQVKMNVVMPSERKRMIDYMMRKNRDAHTEATWNQQQQVYLRHEIQNRSSNLLHRMQYLVNVTKPNEYAKERVDWHLSQLARSQDFVINRQWRCASVEDVTRELLDSFKLNHDAILSGPSLVLQAHYAEHLYLAVFELCLDSVRRSMKSKRGSRFTVRWNILERNGHPYLDYHWHEEAVILDDSRGEGEYAILETIVPKAFIGGVATLTYGPRHMDYDLTGRIT